MNLGQTIRECRQARKLKQSELASLASISVSHLSLLEKGKREPSLSAVTAICEALEIPMAVLIFLAAEASELSSDLSEKQINNISSGLKELVLNVGRQETLF